MPDRTLTLTLTLSPSNRATAEIRRGLLRASKVWICSIQPETEPKGGLAFGVLKSAQVVDHEDHRLPASLQRKDACFRIRKQQHLVAFYEAELAKERCPADSDDLREAIHDCRQRIAREEGLLAGLAEVRHG